LSEIEKAIYATSFLYVLTIGLSKFSTTTFLKQLVYKKLDRKALMFLRIVAVMWMISIGTSVLFSCALPKPWDLHDGECIPMVSTEITGLA
jgi:hypothetical protein